MRESHVAFDTFAHPCFVMVLLAFSGHPELNIRIVLQSVRLLRSHFSQSNSDLKIAGPESTGSGSVPVSGDNALILELNDVLP